MPSMVQKFINFLLPLGLVAHVSACGEDAETQHRDQQLLTDLNTDEQVLLEYVDGNTLAIDLSTDESVVIPGNLIGVMDDVIFTDARQASGGALDLAQYSEALYFQNFSFTTSSWESARTAKVNPVSVTATLDIKTSNGFGRAVTVTLRRDVFGLDPSYTAKSLWLTPTTQTKALTWTTNNQSGDYYIVITKTGAGGDQVSGKLY